MTHQPAGLHDHVATLLDAMGTDPVAIATTLRAEQVHGIRGSVLVHPVCRWLIRLVPDLGAVLGRDTVNVFRPGRGRSIHGAVVPLPDAVRAFADRFDDGEHPELELSMMPPPIPPSVASAEPGPAQEQDGSAEPVEPARMADTESTEPEVLAPAARSKESPDSPQPGGPGQPGSSAGSGAATGTPGTSEPAGAMETAGPQVPSQTAATPESTGSRKAKRSRKPTRPREPEAATDRPAGSASAKCPDASTSSATASAGAGGARAPEPVPQARPTGATRSAAVPVPPRNPMTDTVRLVAVRA